jgi:hypothetical protein
MFQRTERSWTPRAEVMIVPKSECRSGVQVRTVGPLWPLARRTAITAINGGSICPCRSDSKIAVARGAQPDDHGTNRDTRRIRGLWVERGCARNTFWLAP